MSEPSNVAPKDSWFPIEGFFRMRTDYKVALELDELILRPETTQAEVTKFIEKTVEGVKKNERKS